MPKTIQPTFNKGELSPELHGRVDVTAYQGGLATARNTIVHTYGGISRRPGTKYIAPVKDHTTLPRLKRFQFKTTDDYILEFGHQYMRVIRDDGHVLDTSEQESIIGATNASPVVITTSASHGYSAGQEVFIDSVGGMTEINQRRFLVKNPTSDTFELGHQHDNSDIDGTGFGLYTSGGTVDLIFELTTPYDITDVYELGFTQSADVMTIVHPDYDPRELTRTDHDVWTLTTITFAPSTSAPANLSVTTSMTGSDFTLKYVVTAIDDDTQVESLPSNQVSDATSGPSISNPCILDWDNVSGASTYRVYRGRGDSIKGLLAEVTTSTFTDDGAFEVDNTKSPPTSRDPFSGSDNRPRAVGFYQQRRVFGGANNSPDTSQFSKVGDFSNFTRSLVLQDDDAIEATLPSLEVNEIRHYIPLRDLVVLTSGSEFTINAGNADALTPSSITQDVHSKWGSSIIPPEVIGSTILYVSENNSDVRTFEKVDFNQYVGQNLNILSRHLLEGFTITDWTWVRYPDSRLYIVRSDGNALTLSFDLDQETIAWTRFDTDGSFKGVESLRGGGTFNEDSVYWIVERTINGNTVKFIEVMRQTFFDDIEDAFFVDSGLTYDGSATKTLSGLDHLEGETVVALADGNVVSNLTVTNGTVTFTQDVNKAHIGLSYTADIETLNIDTGSGQLQGSLKKISKVVVRFFKSRGLKIGPDSNNLIEMKQREFEAYGEPTALLTGDKEIYISPSWNVNGRIFLRQEDPLPMTILAVIPYFLSEESKDE